MYIKATKKASKYFQHFLVHIIKNIPKVSHLLFQLSSALGLMRNVKFFLMTCHDMAFLETLKNFSNESSFYPNKINQQSSL